MAPRKAAAPAVVEPVFDEAEQQMIERMSAVGVTPEAIADVYNTPLSKDGWALECYHKFIVDSVVTLVTEAGMGQQEANRSIWRVVVRQACTNPDSSTEIRLDHWTDQMILAIDFVRKRRLKNAG